MNLGLMVEGQEGLSWETWRRLMASAEDLGFESLWRSDHLASRIDGRRESLETWVSLALAAAETPRLRLGPLVCPIMFRHPALLAKMAAAVDSLSNGRLILGIGAGWNAEEHRAFGIPFPPLSERLARLTEGIEVVRRLLGPGPAGFAGRYYQLDGADPYPKPVQRPSVPLLVGGMGERVLPIVARYADEWNLTTASPALYRARSARLAEHCHAIGRDPREIRRSVAAGFLIAGSERELQRRCQAMQRLIPQLQEFDASEVPAAVRRNGWIAGTPDAFVAVLRALAAEGIERVMLQHNDLDDAEALNLIAREVLPGV
jgi:F420-dependent oxidoreductase-like protein